VILEDTWEADDVKNWCASKNISCEELSVDTLEAIDAVAFVNSTYMCNTKLVQEKLQEARLQHKVPSTYPVQLRPLLHRNVEEKLLGDISSSNLPSFIKPVSNDKCFDGRVIEDQDSLSRLMEEARDIHCPVWTSDKVSFLVEYRLFIGCGNVYGCGRIQGCSDAVPPASFVNELLACCGSDVYWAVDVGLMTRVHDDSYHSDAGKREAPSCWAVVEVNPPFSLDDHGLDIDSYCQYCQDACEWMRRD